MCNDSASTSYQDIGPSPCAVDACETSENSSVLPRRTPKYSTSEPRNSDSILSTKRLFFILIFLLLFDGIAGLKATQYDIFRYKCPRRCVCVPDMIEVDQLIITCRWRTMKKDSLVDFPRNVTKSLSIDCHGSHSVPSEESELVPNMFDGFVKLRDLKISNCHVKQLDQAIFSGLPLLRSLHLAKVNVPGNAIKMSEAVFEPLDGLEKLTFTESGMHQLPTNVFCPLRYIQILNVSHNSISSAKLGIESSGCLFDSLIILDLSHNNIRGLGSNDLQKFPAIRQLSASTNNLVELHQDAFKTTKLLQFLDIHGNRIREIAQIPESVTHLNLAQNQLAMVPATVANLPNLISLNISGNSINSNTPFILLTESLEVLDMSQNKLDVVPLRFIKASVGNLMQLNLAENEIPVVQPNQFQNFSKLQLLDLSGNLLKSLPDGCFNGLSELSHLHLENNSIYHIDVEAFETLSKRLQHLNLASNLLTELPMAVSRTNRVKVLDLSGNQISKTYKFVLNKIAHLQKLDLSRNRLTTVESYVFSDCGHLNEINLSGNRIETMSYDAFDKNPHLRNVDLSSNSLQTLNGALKDLHSVKHLNLSSNNLRELFWAEFPTELWTLDASGNKISGISSATNSNLKKLELQENLLEALSSHQLPENLEIIDLSRNQIKELANSTFGHLHHLRKVDLRGNRLSVVPKNTFKIEEGSFGFTTQLWLGGNPFECACEMGWIAELSSKSNLEIVDSSETSCRYVLNNTFITLKDVKPDQFLCEYDQTCEPHCICCQYGNCDCKSKCPPGCECFHDHFYKTNIVKCSGMTSESQKEMSFSSKDLPMHATHVYLKNLNISQLKTHDFMGRARLVELHINKSELKSIQPLAFNTLPSLQTLSLAGNHLTRISGDEMFKTAKIERLLLNDNQIAYIDDRILEMMPNLRAINLQNNKLEDLPEFASKSKIAKFDLGGNPYRCDCDAQRFRLQSWIPTHVKLIQDLDEVYCMENVTRAFLENDTTSLSAFPPNFGEDIFKISMIHFIRDANRTICAIEVGGLFGGGPTKNLLLIVFLALFVVLVLMALIYVMISLVRKNGKMGQNRYKKATPSLNCSTMTPGCSPLPVPLIQYDAFVSYSRRDEPMVVELLCKALEAQDYSLCLLHKDGPRYNSGLHTVSDELIRQLEASRTLIIFLTKNFLENEWRTLQIKTSHQLFAKMKDKTLIAILGDDIMPNELDSELGQILRKNTCLQQNHTLFWNLLMSSMPCRQTPCGSDSSQIYSDMYGSIVPSAIV